MEVIIMKLKRVKKEEVNEVTKHEEYVKRGKKSKRKGGNYERTIAKKFQKQYEIELKRTPQSGGFAKKSELADAFRGDITVVDKTFSLLLHIECKNHKSISIPTWISQAESDCPEGRIPIVIFHEHGTSNDYVVLTKNHFSAHLIRKETEKSIFYNTRFNNKKIAVLKWYRETVQEAGSKYPVVQFTNHKNTKSYVCLSLTDFFSLVPKSKIIERRTFK